MESGHGTLMSHSSEKPFDILLVEDDDEFRETCAMWMSRKGHNVTEAGDAHAALQLCQTKHFDVAVVDLNMPGMNGLELLDRLRSDQIEMQVLMLTGQASVDTAVQAMKLGAYDYLSKPFPLPELEKRCRLAFERGRLQKENQQLKAVIERSRPVVRMIGNSPPMQQVQRLIERAGPTDKAILIQGESGTGKEIVARGLQSCSLRADRPFVTINCAALPEQLVESELFGHEKGSFTGATATKPGLFEVADGGTIFIDEIGEMPLGLQPKLLRVLEDGSLRRVGSHKERRVNVRLIAATNRNLGDMAAEGKFREDLYYRINVLTIELAPLRERDGDIDLLIDHFLGKDWQISPEARDVMRAYHWPGNVRQLINVIERATILAEDGCVQICDLPKEVTGSSDHRVAPVARAMSGFEKLEDLERAHVLQILHSHDGNKARAARALGIHRRKLYRLLERFDIRPEEYA
jgi:DNA-binding NtrC family response regulator